MTSLLRLRPVQLGSEKNNHYLVRLFVYPYSGIMETSLFFKTFVVFGSQLSIVFGICYLFIYSARKATIEGRPFLGATFEKKFNKRGELDLFSAEQEAYDAWREEVDAELESYRYKPNYKEKKKEINLRIAEEEKKIANSLNTLTQTLTWVWIIALIGSTAISFTGLAIYAKMITLTVASIAFGPLLAVIMIQMDENDGLRILALTVFLTILTALIGLFSGIDFSFLGNYLLVTLVGLITWNIISLFRNFTTITKKIVALIGSITFILYLIYDFNRLKQLSEYGVNDWYTAFQIGYSIYLDVLNLLLYLLELLG